MSDAFERTRPDEGLSTLFQIRDLLLRAVIALESMESRQHPTMESKVDEAYIALGKVGANYSAIARKIGVHRNTLMKSENPEWVVWRRYFESVRDGGKPVAIPRSAEEAFTGKELTGSDGSQWTLNSDGSWSEINGEAEGER